MAERGQLSPIIESMATTPDLQTPESLTPDLGTPELGTPADRSGYDTPLTNVSGIIGRDDVAVVGMACRVAGGNNNPEQLWQSIMDKKDASGEIPEWRWEPYQRRDVRNNKVLKETTSRGYFLDNLENFDAAFFGVSPKEAEQIDPQQRISLEVTWEALENAGIPPQSLSGSDTAVFMGVNSDDYSKLLLEDVPNVEAWMGIGTAYCGVPNRISYHLNLMGPSTAVDAACASSLVAIHHGRQALLTGESKIAIAGGVNALCGPGLTAVLDKAGAICSEGRCRSFDNEAAGYGRGEGAAVVVLKLLNDAIAAGDNVLAVLKGSAVAQDGKTNGIMAPNAKAQELVARTALDVGAVDPSTIQYVEAHATSTPLGDPTEVSAIAAVYGKGRSADEPCYIGSVKPNVGHLEAGAGAVGFIKAVTAMNKGLIPPQANLNNPNSKIDWKGSGIRVLKEAEEWPASVGPRRAAVCSYGYGGTVSHAVIEQHETSINGSACERNVNEGIKSSQILLLSSPREKGLVVQAKALADWLSSSGSSHSLRSIAKTLAVRRGHHDHRAAFTVRSHQHAFEVLQAFCKGDTKENVSSGRVMSEKDVVWVFSGHGAQWKGMGLSLLPNQAFRDAVAALEPIVQKEAGFSPLHALQTGDFDSTDKVQVLTYIVQVGFSAVLRSKGLKPSAVIGHSVGEIAASVAAGCLTPTEGALIVTRRAKLYRQVMGSGAMILVNLPFSEIEAEIGGRTDVVAAIDSSPSSCVVSGLVEAVEQLAESLKSRGIKSFRVKTDVAFHSPMLERLSRPLSEALRSSLYPKAPEVPLYSTSLQNPRGTTPHDPSYWIHNMVSPVRLTAAVNAAVEDGLRLFVEVSTHPIISHSINETLLDKEVEEYSVSSVMSRNKTADETLAHCIGQLYCKGVDIEWKKQVVGPWCSHVPTTAWSHKAFWRKIETGPLNASVVHDVDKHTLLGQRTQIANEDAFIYTTKLDDKTKPFPGSHPLHGSEIVPAAGLINTFLHATNSKALSNITLRVPVAISAPRDVQVVVQRDQIKICSQLAQDTAGHERSWVTHTTGFWDNKTDPPLAPMPKFDVKAVKSRIGSKLADKFSIDYLDKVGVSAMGFPWAVDEHYGNLEEMIAHVDVAPGSAPGSALPWDENSWAPILDAATSVGSTIFFDEPRLRMPAQIKGVEIYTAQPPPKLGYLYVQKDSETAYASHVTVLSEDGEPLARFESMRFSEIEGTPGVSGSVESLVHQLAWPPAVYSEEPLAVSNVVLVTEDDAAAQAYRQQLHSRNIVVSRFNRADDLESSAAIELLAQKDTAVAYAPGRVLSDADVQQVSEIFIFQLLDIVKLLVNRSFPSRLFVLTNSVSLGKDNTALAQAALQGLGRIVASEHPDQWGGLVDLEDEAFPLNAVKYVREQDVVRISDGIPRVARLRPLPRSKLQSNPDQQNLLPRPEGTYLITGGLGALGLEVASFLVEKGARRLILISRRSLPPRSEWANKSTLATQRVQELEKLGASIHCLALDIGAPNGAAKLEEAIERLNIPKVLGVVHAAGVLEDQLVMETTPDSFHRVLSPKIAGSLALDAVFPAGSLDFFALFSSCGQLFGFPGQSSYASGNAFLDTLATHRRLQGDNAVAFQWTSWRALGMASSTEFINAELESKGITDITRDEGFRAWQHAAKYNVDHAVVLRSLAFEEGEMLPSPLLQEIATGKASESSSSSSNASSSSSSKEENARPASGPELKAWLSERVKECVVRVLRLSDTDEVDARAPLSDMGIDSVMTVSLRKQLQAMLGVKVPPTLTWSYPTVGHLVGWFAEKLGA